MSVKEMRKTFSSAATHARIERIRDALRIREMTTIEIAEAVGIHPAYAREYVKHLRETFQIHIVGYATIKDQHTWHKPIYAWGVGADAPPPKRLSHAERSRIRRLDPEFRLREAAKQRAKRIVPYRDWTAAWIPTRAAA